MVIKPHIISVQLSAWPTRNDKECIFLYFFFFGFVFSYKISRGTTKHKKIPLKKRKKKFIFIYIELLDISIPWAEKMERSCLRL